jgi:hypothetical protein
MRPRFLRAERWATIDWGQLALLVWAIVLLVVCTRTAIQPRTRSLFYTYASAGADWIDGNNLYYHDDWPSYLDQYRYSPFVAVTFTPLSFLNERFGNVLWRLFNAGVFLGGLWWWLRTVLPDARTNSLKAAMYLLVVPLSLASLSNGQTNPLVIGFLLMATAALQSKRFTLGALFIACACALKLYPIAVGLLLLLIYPRQLSWRLALMLIAAAVLPFCFQWPEYVLDQYRQWFHLLGSDDRKDFPLHIAYRDLWLLFRIGGVPGTPTAWAFYRGVQLVAAALCAGLVVATRWAGLSKSRQLTAALMLGCCWMTLCGPATESCSFVQLAPALAWALIASRLENWPASVRWLPTAGFILLLIGVLAGLVPWTGYIHGLGEQALGTLLLSIAYVAMTAHAVVHVKQSLRSNEVTVQARAA